MQKLIHKELIFVAILFLFEIAGVATLFFLLDNNYFSEIIYDIFLGFLLVIILLNLITMLFSLNKIAKAKLKTDLSALSILGSDIQEAYNFGQLGLIITDDNNEVIWVNKIFEDIQKTLIDRQLFDWEPQLEKLKDPSISELKLQIDKNFYLVKHLKKANLYIFKNITKNEILAQQALDTSPAVGIICIDNYQDLSNLLDDVDINDNLVAVQKMILEYAKKYNLMIKKYKTDSYFFFCHHIDYERMVSDRLSLLQSVNTISGDNHLTLSIGLSSGIDNYARLFEMASTALDVALSRGGNQAVISNYGENLRFLGGQTEAKEQKNTTKARTTSNTIKKIMEEASSIYVMGHRLADLDAIGSSLGMYCYVTALNKKVKIVYDDSNIESKTRKAFRKVFTSEQINEMTIDPTNAVENFTPKSLLILVDVHAADNTLSASLVKKATKVIIIDHHRRGERCVSNTELTCIDPSASSASEMITELIRYASISINIPPMIATFMLSGIILDTNFYRNKTGAKAYDASYYLKTCGADNNVAYSFLKEEYEEYALKAKIMSTMSMPVTGVAFLYADEKEIVEQSMLARVATEALTIADVKASFAIGKISDKEIGLSSRSDGTISCQLLCEYLKGGGSFTAAAAKFDTTNLEEIKERVKGVIVQYIDSATNGK